MATTNRLYILAAFIFSAIAAIFNIVSLSTEEWITAKGIWSDSTVNNYINYGLFQGNYQRYFGVPNNFQVTMTCSFKHNVCALLCGKDGEARADLLDNLYNNKIDPNYSMDDCAYTSIRSSFMLKNVPVRGTTVTNISTKSFINAGVWLCTLLFLIVALLLGAAGSVLALYNAVSNPIHYFLSVRSLFMYNAVAFCCTVLYMALWGTIYIVRIFHNVSIYDSIVGSSLDSDKMAYLGYSYWIGFIPMAFYAGSVGILYYREYLNERDPKQKRVALDQDSSDPNLYLY